MKFKIKNTKSIVEAEPVRYKVTFGDGTIVYMDADKLEENYEYVPEPPTSDKYIIEYRYKSTVLGWTDWKRPSNDGVKGVFDSFEKAKKAAAREEKDMNSDGCGNYEYRAVLKWPALN